MDLRRVVVTGLGAITPIGNNLNEYWDSLLKGVSGAAPITRFDASKLKYRTSDSMNVSMLKASPIVLMATTFSRRISSNKTPPTRGRKMRYVRRLVMALFKHQNTKYDNNPYNKS